MYHRRGVLDIESSGMERRGQGEVGALGALQPSGEPAAAEWVEAHSGRGWLGERTQQGLSVDTRLGEHAAAESLGEF